MYWINQYYGYFCPVIDILANGGCALEEYNILDYCPLFTPPDCSLKIYISSVTEKLETSNFGHQINIIAIWNTSIRNFISGSSDAISS